MSFITLTGWKDGVEVFVRAADVSVVRSIGIPYHTDSVPRGLATSIQCGDSARPEWVRETPEQVLDLIEGEAEAERALGNEGLARILRTLERPPLFAPLDPAWVDGTAAAEWHPRRFDAGTPSEQIADLLGTGRRIPRVISPHLAPLDGAADGPHGAEDGGGL
jgi:hypothetical protein